MANFGNKFKSFLKNNYRILLMMLFFLILNCALMTILYFVQNGTISTKRFIFAIILISLLTIVLCAFIIYAKHKKWQIEKIFLVVGSILGLFYLVAIPIGRTPDEPAHYWRVYAIAHGDIIPQIQDNRAGSYLPENLKDLGDDVFKEDAYNKLASRITEPVSSELAYRKTITNTPLSYLPQIIGAFIGSILHLPLILILYLIRICGLAACITITYFCLKYIPILKKSLFFLACLPLTMQTFIAISYDGMIFCAAISIITFVLYSIYTPKFKLSLRHFLLLTISSIILLVAKPTYFPILTLLLFIPGRCFKTTKIKIISIISICIITILLYILWMLLIPLPILPGNNADTAGQISYILSNPLNYIVILIQNIINMPLDYVISLNTMEWLDVQPSHFYIFAIPIIFTLLCTDERLTTKFKIPSLLKWFSLACVTLSLVLVYTALYIQWTPVGEFIIKGVQSRYFLPILPLVPLACLSTNLKAITKNNRHIISSIFLYSIVIFINMNALAAVVFSHI